MALYENTWQAVAVRVAGAARAAGREPSHIRILAVSKAQPAEAIRAAYAVGQRAFGENYVQEALTKIEALADLPHLEWHLIGPLQGNKARAAAAHFAWIHSIDRMAIAQRLSDARNAGQAPLNVCIQVNISGEASKSGCAPGAALTLAHAVARLPRLALRGFMGIAEEGADMARKRAQFHTLRTLRDRARSAGLDVDTLSMGMSGDLEEAIAEGATCVRIGTALFGVRQVAKAI